MLAMVVIATTSSASANETTAADGRSAILLSAVLFSRPVPQSVVPTMNPALLRLKARIQGFLDGPGPSVTFSRGGPLVHVRWTFSLDPVEGPDDRL